MVIQHYTTTNFIHLNVSSDIDILLTWHFVKPASHSSLYNALGNPSTSVLDVVGFPAECIHFISFEPCGAKISSSMILWWLIISNSHSISWCLSYPIHSRFSSKVPDTRSDQIWSTDLFQIRYNKLLHSYPVHIMLNTAYFLHLVYLPFQYLGYAYFRLCLLIC